MLQAAMAPYVTVSRLWAYHFDGLGVPLVKLVKPIVD